MIWALPALLVLILPAAGFAALGLSPAAPLDAGDWHALLTSLLGGGVALGLIALLGTPLALLLSAPARGAARRMAGVAEILVLLPMLTPTLALGILLAASLGPATPIGAGFARIGLSLTNSFPAFVAAGLYGGLPVFIVGARAAFAGVPAPLVDVARSLGDSELRLFFRIRLPLARRGLAASLALAWVRAIGEFGIVLIIAYFPQGLPVRLWVDMQDLGISAVFPLLAAFLVLALPLPLFLGLRARA